MFVIFPVKSKEMTGQASRPHYARKTRTRSAALAKLGKIICLDMQRVVLIGRLKLVLYRIVYV